MPVSLIITCSEKLQKKQERILTLDCRNLTRTVRCNGFNNTPGEIMKVICRFQSEFEQAGWIDLSRLGKTSCLPDSGRELLGESFREFGKFFPKSHPKRSLERRLGAWRVLLSNCCNSSSLQVAKSRKPEVGIFFSAAAWLLFFMTSSNRSVRRTWKAGAGHYLGVLKAAIITTIAGALSRSSTTFNCVDVEPPTPWHACPGQIHQRNAH